MFCHLPSLLVTAQKTERVCVTELLGSCVAIVVLAVLNEGLTVLREYIDMTSDRRDKLEGASNRPRDDVVGGRTPSTDGDGSKTAVSLEQLDEHDHRQYA